MELPNMRLRIRLRRPWQVKMVSFLGAGALRLWLGTLQYHYRPLGPSVDPHEADLDGRYIYAMWHETMLLPVQRYARPDISVLVSKHADGRLIGDICRRLKVGVVHGSTTRGGVEAIRGLLQEGRHKHLAMTPDGPRGPRQKVQAGVIYLAARLGLPIVPVGFGFERPWRLRSWDRFVLPRPWTRGTCVTGYPVTVPPDAGREELEAYRQHVEEALVQATDCADRWASSGRWTQPATPIRLPAHGLVKTAASLDQSDQRVIAVA
jgi:lysophospholipid acyltransferase (LPLAT)-like uncharacterized protein